MTADYEAKRVRVVLSRCLPRLEAMGRLIACDLVGMGGSEKLSPSGPDRYRYAEHRDYLFALWDALDLGDSVVLVLDGWGAVLGFAWARQNSDPVQDTVPWKLLPPL
jgi:haloalkane dehalogenase